MRQKDIIIGGYYRYKQSKYCWARVIEIIQPLKGLNITNKVIAKVEWSTDKGSSVGVIKHFAVSDLTQHCEIIKTAKVVK